MIKYVIVPAVALAALGSVPAAAQQAAQQPPTRAAVQQTLDAQFKANDTNSDGSLSAAELAAAEGKLIQQRVGQIRARAEAQFAQLDTNKNGQLSKDEFMALAAKVKAPVADGSAALGKFDANKDGKVSADEFRTPLLAQFDAVDTNKDGTISQAEGQAASNR